MRSLALLLGLGFVVAAGCGEDGPNYPPLENDCSQSERCVTTVAGAGSDSSGGGGDAGTAGGGAGSTTEVTGSVDLIASNAFVDTGTAFSGAATIIVNPSGGSSLSAAYGGTSGLTTFDLPGVPTGNVWFFVEDASNGASGILSTYQRVGLPVSGPVTLEVVSLQTLTNVGSQIPSVATVGISPLAPQIILILQHEGAPYQGVTVSGGVVSSGTTIVAYDQGPGVYSDQGSNMTQSAGTIILFNANLSAYGNITLTDTATSTQLPVSVQYGAGAATLATFSL
jgi:hypothetical protein